MKACALKTTRTDDPPLGTASRILQVLSAVHTPHGSLWENPSTNAMPGISSRKYSGTVPSSLSSRLQEILQISSMSFRPRKRSGMGMISYWLLKIENFAAGLPIWAIMSARCSGVNNVVSITTAQKSEFLKNCSKLCHIFFVHTFFPIYLGQFISEKFFAYSFTHLPKYTPFIFFRHLAANCI